MRSSYTAVRMGPITIITLLIVIALATLSVLSLTTARASAIAADKQDGSIQAYYENEREAQEFLAQVDELIAEQVLAGATPEQAAEAIAARNIAPEIRSQGQDIHAQFQHGQRYLNVVLNLRSDLSYQISSWTTETMTDTTEQVSLWSGTAT